MRVLLTGASGFIGGRLLAVLRGAGHEVVPVLRRPAPGAVSADLGDEAAVRAAVAAVRPDAIVNAAGIAHVDVARVGEAAYEEVNHRGVARLLAAAEETGVRRLVQLGSATVYGEVPRPGPVDEDAPLHPRGPYARSKRDAETACARSPLETVVLRLPAVYAADFLLNLRKRACVPGTGGRVRLRVLGPQPLYSICHVDHVSEAVRMGLAELPAGVYNVADEAPVPQREVARVVGTLDGVRATLPVHPAWVGLPIAAAAPLLPARVAEGLRVNHHKLFGGLVLDTTRARAAGLRGRHGLADLLREAGR